jgi:hypothetical protein
MLHYLYLIRSVGSDRKPFIVIIIIVINDAPVFSIIVPRSNCICTLAQFSRHNQTLPSAADALYESCIRF